MKDELIENLKKYIELSKKKNINDLKFKQFKNFNQMFYHSGLGIMDSTEIFETMEEAFKAAGQNDIAEDLSSIKAKFEDASEEMCKKFELDSNENKDLMSGIIDTKNKIKSLLTEKENPKCLFVDLTVIRKKNKAINELLLYCEEKNIVFSQNKPNYIFIPNLNSEEITRELKSSKLNFLKGAINLGAFSDRYTFDKNEIFLDGSLINIEDTEKLEDFIKKISKRNTVKKTLK